MMVGVVLNMMVIAELHMEIDYVPYELKGRMIMEKTSNQLPWELQNALKEKWELGQTRRITHLERLDGTNCSKGKNASLSIIRKVDGWWFLCFRCGFKGYVGDTKKSPAEIEAAMEALKHQKEFEAMDCITLPADFQPLCDDPMEHEVGVNIPYTAYNWLWECNITGDEYMRYNVGWSSVYNRCIVPCYEYANTGDELARKLVGWIGRDVRKMTKTERKAGGGTAKYLTRKSSEYKRIFFHAPYKSDVYVIVEDVLSAMKINNAAKVNAIALLNTYVPKDLCLRLRKNRLILWLDADQVGNMIKAVNSLSAIGLRAAYIHTQKDPKRYNSVLIRSKIKEVMT
jgi:hypothetical protein